MKNKNQRHQEAEVRLSEYKKLTTVQKLLKLDLKFGGGLGATRQRARLAQQLEKEKNMPVPTDAPVTNKGKKIYQKPKRS
jgi:hypothetical protein